MTVAGERNLARLAERSFEVKGDHPALLFAGRWYRSGDLFERAARLAAGLQEAGIAPGERVVVTMANCPEVGIAYNALWRAGAVVTPATFLLSEPDLRALIADAEASAVITTPEFLDKVTAAVADLPSVGFVACTEPGPGAIALSDLEAAEPGAIVPRADEDLAALLYTGGTTGRAKGVMLSHANLFYTGASASAASHVPGLTRALATLPLSHSYGILVTIAAMHRPEPGLTVLLARFDATTFLEQVQEHQLQLASVVPSMLQLLLGHELERCDLSSLQYVTSGGAPLAPEVVQAWARRAPQVTIRQGYGLTESAALISSTPTGQGKAGAVGLPVPGTEVRVVDAEGRALPANEVGEITVRSPAVMQGYWRAPEATAQALHDGWLHTGDLGYVDADGYLFIVDRKKDLIIRGGFNVYPRDIEDLLLEHPSVAMSAVVGRPDPVHGEEVVAFVAPNAAAPCTSEALVAWARERIGGYKYPREVHILEAVPLTPVGKIDRKALRQQLREHPVAASAR